jgi:hypothetical protein
MVGVDINKFDNNQKFKTKFMNTDEQIKQLIEIKLEVKIFGERSKRTSEAGERAYPFVAQYCITGSQYLTGDN